MEKQVDREETLTKYFKSTIFEQLAENFGVFQKGSCIFTFFFYKNDQFVYLDIDKFDILCNSSSW